MLTSFIFPAFISEYSGNEQEILRCYSDDFDTLLEKASVHLGIDLTTFDIVQNTFQDHELNTQFISYIFSCAVSDILKAKKVKPDYISGYSMGLYAALYCGQAISFADGLSLIKKVFELIKISTGNIETGMGSIVGLSKEDILAMIETREGVALANTNGQYAYMISGIAPEIKRIIDLAKKEGALHAAVMKVTCPYHTSFLNDVSVQFKDYISQEIVIEDSSLKIVSGIGQRIFTEKDEIIHELTSNLNTEINWLKTMEKMLYLNTTRFAECGAGTSLHKIGKFIKGDFKIYPVSSLDWVLGM
jgi:[acyl-carrier-protein] S-malonyltransferase